MMIKHTVLMTVEEYFALKNYLIRLKADGKFDNDVFIQKFYKSFAIESSIKLDRQHKMFDNANAHITFELENDYTILSTVGLFCREYYSETKRDCPKVAGALRKLKDYISAELLDIFNL